MKKFYSLFILLLLSLVITSCSKKDDNPTGPEASGTAPTFPTITFKGPNTSSTDTYATQTNSVITAFNGFPQMLSGPFSAVKPSSEGGDWKWVVSPGNGATETFYATKNSDGSFTWRLILNGKVDADEDAYNNWKAVDGYTSADGKNGNWKIYKPNTTSTVAEFSWTTNSSGTLTGTIIEYDGSTVSSKMEVVNNADNSGSLKQYGANAVLEFQSSWKADGSGEWHSYNNGVEDNHGNWQ
ncbi:MAG TPA: hypothetical protein VHO03_01160 [Ignavibacteriales bacterium]|nr:hypothetical protein [Ignavibacteriales bacterium]